MRSTLVLPLCLALIVGGLAVAPLAADPVPDPQPLSDVYRRVVRVDVPIEEISGFTALPSSTKTSRHLLAVTDEGSYDAPNDTVHRSLYRLDLAVAADGTVTLARTVPVALDLAGRIDRLDPAWPTHTSFLDLESVVPLPGTEDLFLVGGERNPEDATDGGANRLYVVRYPADDETRAEVIAYLRVRDLVDDLVNDRFEAVAAATAPTLTPSPSAGEASEVGPGRTWTIHAFKERTAFPNRTPVHLQARLHEAPGGWSIDVYGDPGYPPLDGFPLSSIAHPVASQSDACTAPDGAVWVLDRWRREIHVTAPRAGGGLQRARGYDFSGFVADLADAANPREPSPPGLPERIGFGRHEAMAFDAFGWLYLAADMGGGQPSPLTVLAPLAPR